jgi:hypothetical protein
VSAHRCLAQASIALDARYVLHDVDAPEAGSKHPVASQRLTVLVGREPELLGIEVLGEHDLGIECSQHRCEAAEVFGIGAGHDVDVLRAPHHAMGGERESPDDHELDVMLDRKSKQRARSAASALRGSPGRVR